MIRKNLIMNSCIFAMLAVSLHAFGQDVDDSTTTNQTDDAAVTDDTAIADQTAGSVAADQTDNPAPTDDTAITDQATDSVDAAPAPAPAAQPAPAMQTRSANINSDTSDNLVNLAVEGTTCTFTGGTEGNGDVVYTKRNGQKKIKIKLDDKKTYSITKVVFKSGNGENQVECEDNQCNDAAKFKKNGNAVVLKNVNTKTATVAYGIWVKNDSTAEEINCDPRIINK